MGLRPQVIARHAWKTEQKTETNKDRAFPAERTLYTDSWAHVHCTGECHVMVTTLMPQMQIQWHTRKLEYD